MYSILRNPYFEDGSETSTWNVYNNGKYLLVNISGSIQFRHYLYVNLFTLFLLKAIGHRDPGP